MKYLFENPKTGLCLLFTYDSNSVLSHFENKGTLLPAHLSFLHNNFPMTILELKLLASSATTSKLTEVIESITFEMFWEKFGKKEGKEQALKAWNKLSIYEQTLAYNYIDRYNSILAAEKWRTKLMAATYLNQKRFND